MQRGKIIEIIREVTLSHEAKRRLNFSLIDDNLNQIIKTYQPDKKNTVELNVMIVLGLLLFSIMDEYEGDDIKNYQEEIRSFILDRYKNPVQKYFLDRKNQGL